VPRSAYEEFFSNFSTRLPGTVTLPAWTSPTASLSVEGVLRAPAVIWGMEHGFKVDTVRTIDPALRQRHAAPLQPPR
jgi:hypothetical protein